MKEIQIFQVDAFTDTLFSGNPAAVCLLDEALPAETMQSIAAENNLSETAFVNLGSTPFAIRWFTPMSEVELCGHATLAAAFTLFEEGYRTTSDAIEFTSASGLLRASKDADIIYLDFPLDPPRQLQNVKLVADCLGVEPSLLFKGKFDLMAVFEDKQTLLDLEPDFAAIAELKSRGLIVTAPGDDIDFASRFFAPGIGIDEDPVTGSAHTLLAPYWSGRLGKLEMVAEQLSPRGGILYCKLSSNRVLIGGQARAYLKGRISI